MNPPRKPIASKMVPDDTEGTLNPPNAIDKNDPKIKNE
jgi:hypothetical protein